MSSAATETNASTTDEAPKSAAERVQAKFIEDAKKEMEKRRAPHEEYLEFEALLARVTGTGNGSTTVAAKPQTAARRAPRASSGTRQTSGDGIDRPAQFLRILATFPDGGAKISEIHKKMEEEGDACANNYLYRVREGLKDKGFIEHNPTDDKKLQMTDEGKAALAAA